MPSRRGFGTSASRTTTRSTGPSGSYTTPCMPTARKWSAAASQKGRSSKPTAAEYRWRSMTVALARLLLNVEGRPQTRHQVGGLPFCPEVGEVERRLLADHVIVQGH